MRHRQGSASRDAARVPASRLAPIDPRLPWLPSLRLGALTARPVSKTRDVVVQRGRGVGRSSRVQCSLRAGVSAARRRQIGQNRSAHSFFRAAVPRLVDAQIGEGPSHLEQQLKVSPALASRAFASRNSHLIAKGLELSTVSPAPVIAAALVEGSPRMTAKATSPCATPCREAASCGIRRASRR